MHQQEREFKNTVKSKIYALEIQLEKLKSSLSESDLKAYEVERFWRIFDEVERLNIEIYTVLNDGSLRFPTWLFHVVCKNNDLPHVDFMQLFNTMKEQCPEQVLNRVPPRKAQFRLRRADRK